MISGHFMTPDRIERPWYAWIGAGLAAITALARRVKRNMAEHTVKAFTEDLDALTQEVSRMGGLAEAAVNDSLTRKASPPLRSR